MSIQARTKSRTQRRFEAIKDGNVSALPPGPLSSNRLDARLIAVTAQTGIDWGRDINGIVEVTVNLATATQPQVSFLIVQKKKDIEDITRNRRALDAFSLLTQAMKPLEDIDIDEDPLPGMEADLVKLMRINAAVDGAIAQAKAALEDEVHSQKILPKIRKAYRILLKPLNADFDAARITDTKLPEAAQAAVAAAAREAVVASVQGSLAELLEIYKAHSAINGLDADQTNELRDAWMALPADMPTLTTVREKLYGEDAIAQKILAEAQAVEDQRERQKIENQRYGGENARLRHGGSGRAPEHSDEGPPSQA